MRPPFVRSEFTNRALARLRQLQVGELVAWEDLSRLLGMDAQGEGYGYVYSATRILRRERHLYRTVAGVGVKRLPDAEIPGLHAGRRRRQRTQCRLILEEAACVKDFRALDEHARREQNAAVLNAHLLLQFTDHRHYEEQKARCNVLDYPPPPLDPGLFKGA